MNRPSLLLAALLIPAFTSTAQTVATFDNFVLQPDTFYLDTAGADFIDGNVSFEYSWTQSQWGDFWSSGFAYTNKTDSVSSDYTNQYSAKAASGHNSPNYAAVQNGAVLRLINSNLGQYAEGCYVTNSTYAYNSMRDGDMFAKKFGGPSGNDPDWFKLTVRGYALGVLQPDSVEFYLADFRFADNSQDYILKTWEYLDLSSIGLSDSFLFVLSSSDVGAFGMNTPGFFCMDDFTTNLLIGLHDVSSEHISVFPNPAKEKVFIKNVNTEVSYELIDMNGKMVATGKTTGEINISVLKSGVYILRIYESTALITKRIIKE